jgi:hypothetical protein
MKRRVSSRYEDVAEVILRSAFSLSGADLLVVWMNLGAATCVKGPMETSNGNVAAVVPEADCWIVDS